LPVFRFNKALDIARDVKAFLSPKNARRRTPEQRKKLKSKRQELSQITKELRAAKREAERSERNEHIKRAKSKQQEIFRLKNEFRAGKEGASETGALPDFVVIGAAKCGTTYFYHLLTKHPHVEPAAAKELRFFDLLYEEGTEWYRRCFPEPRWKDGRKTISGEGTPSYLFDPHVPERMAKVIPQARLIAMLRNPVDRAYSAYYHRVRNGQDTRSFEETIEAPLKDPHHGQLSRGIYVDYLLHWSRFFSDEQMLVLKSEDFFERPQETLKPVLDFLDLPDWEPEAPELRDKVNKGKYEQKMDPDTRRRLEDFFEPHNRRLYEYLGVDFGW
jgi:Sulfotransferase domain